MFLQLWSLGHDSKLFMNHINQSELDNYSIYTWSWKLEPVDDSNLLSAVFKQSDNARSQLTNEFSGM